MSLTIKRKKDERTVHACTHNLADVPNGVTVCVAELVPGVILKEGTPIAKGTDGLYHVTKTAAVKEAVAAAGTTVKVAKGSHFKSGDAVMLTVGGKAVLISGIDRDSNTTYDTLTLTEAIGAITEGTTLQLASAAATKGAFKYKPTAMTGDTYDVESLANRFASAVTIGQFKESVTAPISDDIKAALTGIHFI